MAIGSFVENLSRAFVGIAAGICLMSPCHHDDKSCGLGWPPRCSVRVSFTISVLLPHERIREVQSLALGRLYDVAKKQNVSEAAGGS